MIFCRTLLFCVLTPVLIFNLTLGHALCSEVSFIGKVNGKEFRLVWSDNFKSPRLYITRGLTKGHALTFSDGLWSVDLAGDHRLTVRVNETSEANHIVLREERKQKFFYFAWTELTGSKKEILSHAISSFDDLPRENSLESAVGEGFRFKDVMRVPYTDKYIDLPAKSKKPLLAIQCEYLSKLMGTPTAARDCLAYSRMSTLLSSVPEAASICSNILYRKDLSFRGLWNKRSEFESCLRPLASMNSACLRGHLNQGRSILRCEHSLNSSSTGVGDIDEASEFLAKKLESLGPASIHYTDSSLSRKITLQLPSAQARKLVLANCYYQYLANSGSRSELSEAFDSCTYSEEANHERPSRDLLSATSHWLLNKVTGVVSVNRPPKNSGLAQSLAARITPKNVPKHFDLPMLGHARQGLSTHYQKYAHYLLSRGWLERELQREGEVQLRAPASVSK